MTLFSWRTWDLDLWTLGWIFFIVFFFVWEYLSSTYGGQEMLTDHLRPMFHAAPVTWYMAVGLWLWMGPHFLFPELEQFIANTVRGGG